MTTGSCSCHRCQPKEHDAHATYPDTHVEDDIEDQVYTVQKYQDPEQPPGCRAGKEKCEATPWVIEEKFKLLPYGTVTWQNLGNHPDDEAKHARETGVPDDDQEGPEK